MTGVQSKLIVISGPSGVGKSTVVRRLLKTCGQPLVLSVSATTRAPRPDETHGENYFFLTKEQFEQHREDGDFLECAEVFGRGDWYGTLRQPVMQALGEGKHVILEIDVEGAGMVMQQFPEALTIFIHPGSLAELEARLRGRNTETEDAIQRRLSVAAAELERSCQYRHVLVNREVDETTAQICQWIEESGEK